MYREIEKLIKFESVKFTDSAIYLYMHRYQSIQYVKLNITRHIFRKELFYKWFWKYLNLILEKTKRNPFVKSEIQFCYPIEWNVKCPSRSQRK